MEWFLALLLWFGSFLTDADKHLQVQAAIAQEQAQAEAQAFMLRKQEEENMFGSAADELTSKEWTILPDSAFQGDAVMIRSQTEQLLTFNNKTYPMQSFGNGYYVMLPISTSLKPGKYSIGNQTLEVRAKSFETQRLQVSQQLLQSTQDTKRIAEDQVKINVARSHSIPNFLYREPFQIPLKGRLTTPFGFTRYVNGNFSGSHRAIDIAAPSGTPIKATNAGKVVLSELLYLSGNAIYIDHGMNLFSQYIHMSKLLVQTGDDVEAGQIIGEVGTTGFSTGPHLHFAFWIGNEPVNPDIFFETTPFQWKP